MADSHTEGTQVGKFCTLRKDTCCDGNKYVEQCTPKWAYIKYPQIYTKRLKNLAPIAAAHGLPTPVVYESRRRSFEAHHLLCVASVTKIVSVNPDPKFQDAVKITKWCVNKPENLIALPMWAHSLRWYCSMVTGEVREVEIMYGAKLPAIGAPPWENLPQHDYDHDKYISDVDKRIQSVVDDAMEDVANHDEASKTLESGLNSAVSWAKGELKRRGGRGAGTHICWQNGMNGRKDWYMPFSMADDGAVAYRAFPNVENNEELSQKLRDLVDAFFGRGG